MNKLINTVQNKLFNTIGIWSIAIYETDNPFSITIDNTKKQPILTARDVTDTDALFVADPFIIKEKNDWYMFFEIYDNNTKRGIIGLASSSDGYIWNYERIVLKENFHLSYPNVFKYKDKYYMMPETGQSGWIKVYEAINFPFEWKCVSNIISGTYYDPSILRHDNKWWLFVEGNKKCSNSLHLFYSENLLSGWIEHSKSPMIKGNPTISRPAGAIIKDNDNIYRYSQDCSNAYGECVRSFQVTKLSTTDYEEVKLGVVVEKSNITDLWNKDGMHTVGFHKINENKWITAVDGHYLKKVSKIKSKLEDIVR